VNASNSRRLALPKPRPKVKAKPVKRLRTRPRAMSAKRRKEQPLIAKVRAACVERDGYCRMAGLMGPCQGDSCWCHMQGKRRSQTRRMTPKERHSTAWTVMLCARHAEMEERHTVRTQYLTDRGADGPMLWAVAQGGPVKWELTA
jgi:hypothetical protein